VPFADEGGCVAFSLEHGGEREAIFFDEARAAGAGEDAFHAGSKGHASGEDAVASGRADGGGTVGVGKAEAFSRELVDVGCGDFGLIVVAAEVAVAKVIGEDEEDVGKAVGLGRGFAGKEQKERQQGGNGRGKWGKCSAIDSGETSKNKRVHGNEFGNVLAGHYEWVLWKFQFQSVANDSKNPGAEDLAAADAVSLLKLPMFFGCCKLKGNEPHKEKSLVRVGIGGWLGCVVGMRGAGSGDDRCDLASIRTAV